MFEGEVTPFDALEFDERLATTDVLYDLAFLLMDLRRAGLNAHANAAMNAYWNATGEEEPALALLGFFMALRAAVRMAVAVEAGDLNEAQIYRQLGMDLLQRSPAMLVAIGGLSGVGKSVAAAELALRLPGPAGARLLRSDVIRKRALGLAPDQRADREVYTLERRAQVYRALALSASAALEAGVNVIADATFQSDATRAYIENAADTIGFCGFWLYAPQSVRLARIVDRCGDASDADAAVAAMQAEPRKLGPLWRRIDADRALDAIVEDLEAGLSKRNQGRPKPD